MTSQPPEMGQPNDSEGNPGGDRSPGVPHLPAIPGVPLPSGDPVYPYNSLNQYPQQVYPSYPSYQGYAGYQQGYYPQGGYPAAYPYGYGAPYPQQPVRRRRGMIAGLVATFVAAALVFLLVGVAVGHSENTVSGQGVALPGAASGSSGTGSGGTGSSGTGGATGGTGGSGTGGTGTGGTNANSGKNVATSSEQVGIVTVVSVLKYQNAESAGTGMILNSNGEILTNNHVVNGATSITVTVQSSGRSYKATVVGTAPTKDVAVLQLKNASGLTPAKFADTADDVSVGDAVTGVGNAGGTGTLTAASGKVTALDQSITATDETGAESERLHDLIEINAGIMSGDSGGPLYDSDGQIIGIDTAASTNQTSTTTRAYAISIDNAMSVARQIESGVKTTTIHIGLPGFLGIAPVNNAKGGVGVQTVQPGEPAAKAGITDGSVITSVNGTKITSSTQLHNVLAAAGPGDKVAVSWTGANGTSHTATITLATGPAD